MSLRMKTGGSLCLISFALALTFALIFYPGFMSYDSLHAYTGSVKGVYDSAWPPMVSYVWRLVNLVSADPVAMFSVQLFLFFIGYLGISIVFQNNLIYSIFSLLLILFIPSILGTIVVIWKDVLMTSLFLISFLFAALSELCKSKKSSRFLILLSIVFVFVAACVRHNAIFAAVPILFYISICALRYSKVRFYKISFILLFFVLTVTIYGGKRMLDSYSLPSLDRIDDSTSTFIDTVRVVDLAGASLCANQNFLKPISDIDSVDFIKENYDVKHINRSLNLTTRVDYKKDILSQWISVALSHPLCILANKVGILYYLVGADTGKQFLITHDTVNENEFGIVQSPSPIRASIVRYIQNKSAFLLFKPWFYIAVSLVLIFFAAKKRLVNLPQYVLLASAFLYMGSLVVFGNAADARLLFYTNTIMLLLGLTTARLIYKKYCSRVS